MAKRNIAKNKSGKNKNTKSKRTSNSVNSSKKTNNIVRNTDKNVKGNTKAAATEKIIEENTKVDNTLPSNFSKAKSQGHKIVSKKKTIAKARGNLIYANNDSSDEISKLLKIVLIVTLIMVVFYGITTIVTRKSNAIKTVKNSKTHDKATIQYDELIIGSMLNMDGTYYVLIEKDGDSNLSEYDTLVQTVEANEDSSKVYKANLSDSFNKKYLASDSNYDSDLSNFKVSGTTLIKISNHEIDGTYDTYDSIKSQLQELE